VKKTAREKREKERRLRRGIYPCLEPLDSGIPNRLACILTTLDYLKTSNTGIDIISMNK
jgi:hypothetical protein